MTTKQEVTAVGFVLKSHAYKENDAILSIYTEEYGKISIIAKGIKKVKSKNAAGCQTLTLSEFTFVPRKGLSSLIKAIPIQYFRHIKENIELEIYASYCSEFIYKFVEDNDPDDTLYQEFIKAIECLEGGYPYNLIYTLYNAMILRNTGTPLVIDHCAYCGSSSNIVAISHTGGGFVCQKCKGEYDKVYSKEVLRAFRHINKCTFASIDKLQLDTLYVQVLVPVMEQYIDDYTGIVFNTKTFIKQFQKQ